MRPLDWVVLCASLAFVVGYGIWKSRGARDLQGYLLAGRSQRWITITLSIMATQASAITFLSTPGQAYADGMRFVQFYFGLPIAMVVLSVTAVPLYHRLKVYTAYEYLEGRFDAKTRALTASLFLIQRGLAAGLTILAPALVLSVLLGWDLTLTNLVIGVLVILYTTLGGTRAVSWTHLQQMIIIFVGMFAAFVVIILRLPQDVSFLDAVRVSGAMGRLNAVDFTFDLSNRYTFWSGILGGTFLALSYFGTDQSQVQRYLTGRSVTESRMALIANGFIKVPMQFFILFIGAMVFAFYQFQPPPIFFNPVATAQIAESPRADEFRALEEQYRESHGAQQVELRSLLAALDDDDESAVAAARERVEGIQARSEEVRQDAIALLAENDPDLDRSDTNYVFLTFVLGFLPAGLVGLVLAAILSASMSSTSAELNALASTTVVDLYKRFWRPDAGERHSVRVSKGLTVFWGALAILFAESAARLGSLVEAVNILGSLFYGTILGVFLLAFYGGRRVDGTSVFVAALVAEAMVVACWLLDAMAFLWLNAVGCLAVVVVGLLLAALRKQPPPSLVSEARQE